MVDIKRTVIAIMYDEIFSKLDDATRNIPYVFKEARKVTRKHYRVSKNDTVMFNVCYAIANEAWINSQKPYIDNGLQYSTILMMKFLREDNDWLNRYFKLSQKSWNKLEDTYDLSQHILRTKKILNSLYKNIDISIAQYNYRKEN